MVTSVPERMERLSSEVFCKKLYEIIYFTITHLLFIGPNTRRQTIPQSSSKKLARKGRWVNRLLFFKSQALDNVATVWLCFNSMWRLCNSRTILAIAGESDSITARVNRQVVDHLSSRLPTPNPCPDFLFATSNGDKGIFRSSGRIAADDFVGLSIRGDRQGGQIWLVAITCRMVWHCLFSLKNK
jgi:hypothetical protein